MLYDLHVHTTASDGIYSPSEVIEQAKEIGLSGLAITDHDTFGGLQEARDYADKYTKDLLVIPGIEMNTELDESEIHILGYFINVNNSDILSRLEEIKQARIERALNMIRRLHTMGMIISFEQVRKLAQGDLIARPHIAQALQDKGYVFSIKEAFEKFIGRGKPAYVPRYKFLPGEAIELIRNAGGISSLAHPGLISNQNLILEVIKMGVDGLEVYYPEHNNFQENEYINLSRKFNKVITGGSDFHGTGTEESHKKLGRSGINKTLMAELIHYYSMRS
ncbi:MAG: PHP domain-containing protein [Syntrophomonadaceae bacterium]|nr:PHP domain-containing protein [Syntrophomonadaceae bacterium]